MRDIIKCEEHGTPMSFSPRIWFTPDGRPNGQDPQAEDFYCDDCEGAPDFSNDAWDRAVAFLRRFEEKLEEALEGGE